MESSLIKRNERRKRRVFRIRKHVRGNAGKPRLCIYKTNQHISAQLIDDESHLTIVSAGTQQKDFPKNAEARKCKDSARQVGKLIAEKAKEKSITAIVFDRGRYKFHGIIAELAAGAREAGLQF
ncbi:MAG: 50S ribosomal protein L18 [Simkania sp.]|nr:50S ribosomal protein L18 [Simkania sp.]